ncbi:unnamed protein product [Agarophyton chilense]
MHLLRLLGRGRFDQRHRRRRAQRRLEEDGNYLAEKARREEEQRNSRRDSALGVAADAISEQQSSRNAKYQRVRQQTASGGYVDDDYLHDPVPHPLNSSPVEYAQPTETHDDEQAASHYQRARRPHSARSRPSEQRNGENEATGEKPQEQQDENEEEDGDDLLAGGRGLLKKFANSKKFWDKRKEQQKEEEEGEEDEAIEAYCAAGPFDSEEIYLGPNPLNLVPPPTKFSVKVPQNDAFIVEKGGRFHRKLNAGRNTLIPCMDHIAFRYSLKEASMPIAWQQCFTGEKVPIHVNALLFVRVDDPVSASYEIDNPYHAIIMLVQSSIKRDFNKLSVEQACTERYHLDQVIEDIINTALRAWGVRCTRFEIKQVELPEDLRISLENAAAADRQRREEVRAAETQCEIMVNRAEAEMQLQMKGAQARQVDMVNQAIGEAHAISERSEAIASAM